MKKATIFQGELFTLICFSFAEGFFLFFNFFPTLPYNQIQKKRTQMKLEMAV